MSRKIKRLRIRLKEEKGQSIVILAFAFLALVGMLGLALDLGLVYIERVALERAVDAAVLSGVLELPSEEDAAVRALEYLSLNGYDRNETEVYFIGCFQDGTDILNHTTYNEAVPYRAAGVPDDQIKNRFWINTFDYQDDSFAATDHTQRCPDPDYGTANKLEVRGEVDVDMNFMLFFGFDTATVPGRAVAQNIDTLDVAIVFDRSGSMEFDPVCYGCWERDGDSASDYGTDEEFYTYPSNGTYFPIGYDLIPTENHPDGGFASPEVQRVISHTLANSDVGTSVYQAGGDTYIIMEAELYSQNNSVVDTTFRQNGKGYWALQRGEGNYDSGSQPYFASEGTSIDGKGAHMAHHPSPTLYPGIEPYGYHYTLAEANSGSAPGLEYDFEFRSGGGVSWGSTASVWARVHPGRGLTVSTGQYGDSGDGTYAYWAIAQAADWTGLSRPTLFDVPGVTAGTGTGWQWVELTDSLPVIIGNKYRLYFHAGSSGFSIDRIVVTDDNGTLPSEVRDGTIKATTGSAYRDAAEKCNPIYAAQVTEADIANIATVCPFRQPSLPIDNRLNPLFGEWEAPMRPAKEAVKRFIAELEDFGPGEGQGITRNQVGLVSYNGSNTTTITHLRCLKRWGINDCRDTYKYDEVLVALESMEAGGTTNTGAGMRDGLVILGEPGGGSACNPGGQCARGGGAQKIVILLTDGVPNTSPSGCPGDSSRPNWPTNNNADYECPLYYAQEAADAGITVYTIGIGYGVDHDWMEEIAALGNGFYSFDPTGADLDRIFNEILGNIYVRLVE